MLENSFLDFISKSSLGPRSSLSAFKTDISKSFIFRTIAYLGDISADRGVVMTKSFVEILQTIARISSEFYLAPTQLMWVANFQIIFHFQKIYFDRKQQQLTPEGQG